MPDYGAALNEMISGASTTAPTLSNDQLDTLNQAQQMQQQAIDIQTSALQPQAQTSSGQFVLQDLIANKQANPIDRAAAAQALNPGLKANVQQDGTLSFSAAPGADLGFKYPDQTRKPNSATTAGAFGRASDAQTAFNDTYKAIQGMSDTNEITNAYASLTQSTAAYVESKRQALVTRIGSSMGLTDLENQMAADKVADAQFYNTYYNGQNLGPTDESLRTIGLYQQKKLDVDREVAKQLAADPELAGMNIRMQQLNVLVDQKTKEAFSTTAINREAQAALIPEDQVNKALIALGTDPTTATAEQRQQLAIKIPTTPYYHTAMQVGNMDPTSLAVTAASDAGDAGVMANRVLKDQFKEKPDDLKTVLDNYRNFDSPGGLGTQLPKEMKEGLKLPPTVTAGSKEGQALQQRANVLKMSLVIQDLQNKRAAAFSQSIDSWAVPQSPLLKDEIPGIIKDLKAVNKDQPITMDQVTSRMDWKNGGQAKIDAMTDYINSQATNMPNNQFFGAPVQYANPQLTRQWVQTIAVRSQVDTVPGYDQFSPYSGY